MEWWWQWHSIGISLYCFILPSEATKWWMERYPSCILSECVKTLQKHVIMVIKHVCSSTLIKEKSPTKNSKSHTCHFTWHSPPVPPDVLLTVTLITGHTLTVTITDIISCVFPSWRIFYFKSTIYDLQPTLYISQPPKTTGKNDRFIYLLTFYIMNSLQVTEGYTQKSMAGITHIYLHHRRD
jgi:hypothetical protein